jgi:hypothetical protein
MSAVRNGRRAFAAAVALFFAAPGLHATDLDVRVRSGGLASVQVAPGASVPFALIGELTDAASDGLALFSLDLGWDGATALTPAASPAGAPMTSFAVPNGVNNPQGFGGVAIPGGLRQIGGGQNTLNNSFGPYPVGSVAVGVAQPGAAVTLATGSLTAPLTPGNYTLSVTRVVANVITAGATGIPVWRVAPAGAGTLSSLVVQVQSLAASRARRPARARRETPRVQ